MQFKPYNYNINHITTLDTFRCDTCSSNQLSSRLCAHTARDRPMIHNSASFTNGTVLHFLYGYEIEERAIQQCIRLTVSSGPPEDGCAWCSFVLCRDRSLHHGFHLPHTTVDARLRQGCAKFRGTIPLIISQASSGIASRSSNF